MRRGPKDPATLEALLLGIVDRVTRRMRAADRVGRTVTMRFRYDDFARATRARTLSHPTAGTGPIGDVALAVLRAELPVIDERGLTLLGLSVGNLATTRHEPEQLLLPFGRKDPARPGGGLDGAVDALRERFGHRVLTRASLLGRTVGFEVPKLPD